MGQHRLYKKLSETKFYAKLNLKNYAKLYIYMRLWNYKSIKIK